MRLLGPHWDRGHLARICEVCVATRACLREAEASLRRRQAAPDLIGGAVHTQTIEDFWSIFKRGIMGTFHKVSRKYLPLYVAEFQFRYNNRDNADIFGEAIRRC